MQVGRIEEATKCWLLNTVIKHNFCPFAKREFDRESIRYLVSDTNDMAQQLEQLVKECHYLDKHPEAETSLLVFSEGLGLFDDFLDFVALANEVLVDQGYEGTYQLANFHPDYCFDGDDEADPANYTNRSPWPMLHLIREESLEKAIASHPDPEGIPDRNIALARDLGQELLQKQLDRCSK